MAEKSYLKNQIKLVSLNANDLFTDEEWNKYMEIISYINEIERLEDKEDPESIAFKKELIAKKKKCSEELSKIILKHKGVPRRVRKASVIYVEKDKELPAGITWSNLKLSRKIAEFESEMSRAMGLHTDDYTFDKIVIKWKNQDVLHQIVSDGFEMELLQPDGSIEIKKYQFLTASAGQLRRDKLQAISVDMWEKIKDRIQCGLTWDVLNEKNGVNVNKYLAYLALPCSATDPWEDFDIDKCIVIPDWEGEVTDRMLYIKNDYTTEDAVRTVLINHVDGAGMILPSESSKNFMFRGPYCIGPSCSNV